MDKELNVVTVKAADVRADVSLFKQGSAKQRKACDNLAVFFRETVMPAAEGDFGKAWPALSKAVQGVAIGKADKDTEDYKEGVRTWRSIMQNVRNRVSDLTPVREQDTAEAEASETRKAVTDGLRKTAKYAERFNALVSLAALVASIEDTEDVTDPEACKPLVAALKRITDNIRKTASKPAEEQAEAK